MTKRKINLSGIIPHIAIPRYLPASTFKIPNLIIALEEDLIKDTLQIIKWDGKKWPLEN